MSAKAICTGLSALFALSPVVLADVPNEKITALMTLCEANPSCSHEAVNKDGGVLLNINEENQVKHIACQNDGLCMMVMPRGVRFTVSDVITKLTPK
jgi:hypothetical protein